MSFSFLSRRLHRWGAIAIGLPLLCVVVSGLLLQVKKQFPWVQPHEERTPVSTPAVGWDVILAAAKAMPEAGCRAGRTSSASMSGRRRGS
jgi:uncharacterized iron-regulated membrane protein